MMDALLISLLILSNFFLYFYNLIHDKTNSIKDLLIRIMLLGFTSISFYQAYRGNKIDCLFFVVPVLIFIVVCLIKKYPIKNKYTKHIAWLYLSCLVGFVLFYIQKTYLIEEQDTNHFLFLPLIFVMGLIFYFVIDYLIYLRPLLGRHDKLCLLWCCSLAIIWLTDFTHLEFGDTLFILFFLIMLNVFILGIAIFLYHSFYFIRLIFFNPSRRSNEKH